MRDSNHKLTVLLVFIIVQGFTLISANPEAPVLDIDNQSVGYVGKISEHSILVDLFPHLQIKNIEAINGICSYHVFKPNSEEFPFTVEIKDKLTGEAVIQLMRKDLHNEQHVIDNHARSSAKSILLDCDKQKEFDFLIQAHDCSMPSLYSNKVPVRIEVMDSDDYELQFDASKYQKTFIKSEHTNENFLTVSARDNDCTNNGFACSYSLEHVTTLVDEFPFVISSNGKLSSKRPLNEATVYDFRVRAYDCVNNSSYVEAPVHIEIVEPCVPQWTNLPKDIVSISKNTNLFEQLNSISCENQQTSVGVDYDHSCHIDSANSKLELVLSPEIHETCELTDCTNQNSKISSKKSVIFDATGNTHDDDSIEDDYYNLNKIDNQEEDGINLQPPMNYRSFSKTIENAQKINFDGSFGNKFTLNTWIRRPANADKRIKEQVFCGSDSLAMNRHHFGLYFYRGSIKFLMRKENLPENKENVFYPSLWEWSLPNSILNDNRWHYYEIRLDYPKAMLYIDGTHFIENKTNSDIIDAYELAHSDNTGEVVTYVGACYHSRTNSLVDHFEGDIGNVVLKKTEKNSNEQSEKQCKKKCHESIEMNMVGNENFIDSIEHVNANEIKIHTSNLNDMTQILRRVNYINTDTYPQEGTRKIKLSTTLHCGNNGKQINLNELVMNLNLKHHKHEYNVLLEGDKTQAVTKYELENGIEPFREVAIFSYEINKIDDESLETESGDDKLLISQCQIRITPERNTMQPDQNYEKIMFLQNLLDEFKFEFKETIDSVLISGIQSAKNYESFIRRLTYVITNVHEIDEDKFIKQKQFFISCTRQEPSIETNTVIVQLNVIGDEKNAKIEHRASRFGFVAHKQAQKLVVGEDDKGIILDKMNIPHSYNYNASSANPIVVLIVALCVCGMSFFLIFGAIRLNNTLFGNKRRPLSNEENPNMDGMEWDDSGLNITENPLDKLEAKKDSMVNLDIIQNEYDDDEEYTSNEEDDEEYDQYEDQYSSEEENNILERGGLEWDDTSIGIKMNKKIQLQSELAQNDNDFDSSINKFV